MKKTFASSLLALALVSTSACANQRPLPRVADDGEDVTRRYLASHRVPIDEVDRYGSTALHVASAHCDAALARLLLERGADAGRRDGRGRTPLLIASELGCPETIYVLLVGGASTDARVDPGGASALHLAAVAAPLAAGDLLLKAGADANAVNAWNQTPLHDAARGVWGHAEDFTRLLLAHGARVDVADVHGFTPLHVAAAHNNVRLVRLLAAAGADLTARSTAGNTPLDVALGLQCDEVSEALLEAGAPRDLRVDAESPLHAAARSGDVDWALHLLSLGADPTKRMGGKTALDVAIAAGNEGVARLLRERAARVTAP